MTVIHELMQRLISRQVSDSGVVVWYDPGGFYRDLVNHLTLAGTSFFAYKDSFFALRAQIEPLLDLSEPPKLMVYVPMDQTQTHHALIELEAAGTTMKPGASPQACNTRPSYIARLALQPILGEAAALAIEKQVEEGKLTLADLEELAEQGSGLSKGVVSLIFGTGIPQDVALAFLSSDQYDAEIKAKEALPELASLLQTVYEFHLAGDVEPKAYRKALVRFILLSDLAHRIHSPLPGALSSVPAASKPAPKSACADLTHTWRNRRDICESYVTQANYVENELHIKDIPFTLEQLMQVETFQNLEHRLMKMVTGQLVEDVQEPLVIFAEERQSTFWPEQLSELQAQWALIATAGKLLLQAQRIEKALRKLPNLEAVEIAKLYTESEEPWCLLDTYHRNMERRYHQFNFDTTGSHSLVERLITEAREAYMKTGGLLAERFTRAYLAAGFSLPGVLLQRDVFDKQHRLSLLSGHEAFIWVDALRYEMGRELAETLAGEFEVTIQYAVASVPTLTEIGMASLLPLPKEPPVIYSPADSKLALNVSDTLLRDRRDRIGFLKRNIAMPVVDVRLDELLPNPKKALRDSIKSADMVLVTSQEIDELCEGDNVHLARRIMDDMLLELRRVFRVLREQGVKTIICTADHGYLFGDDVNVAMKIDPPGGKTVDLHRRVWIGQGGSADLAYMRASLNQFGWETDLEIAVPWNFACFKVKGGTRAYFHGGLSPQELFIPVLVIKPLAEQPVEAGSFNWKMFPGTPKISTRFYSVQISGEIAGLFEAIPPKVHIEIRSGKMNIARAISASYGFSEATGDVQIRLSSEDTQKIEANTITLMITEEPEDKKSVSVVLLDVESGIELSRLDNIEIGFSI